MKDYFNNFLSERIGVPLVDEFESLNSDFAISFKDLACTWFLTVEKGIITKINPDEGKATVRFIVTEPVFMDIVSGRLAPDSAFFRHKTDIKGNLFEGMRLAKMLALFFNKHPYLGSEQVKSEFIR